MSKAKKISQREHFQKRMIERYGINVSKDKCSQIIQEIISGKHVFIEKQSLRVSKHRVIIDGVSVVVIYDKQRKMLVTALPKDENNTTS